jgi:hypothetical protein
MTERRALQVCLLAGLAALAIAIAMVPWNPTRGCGEASATPPIIAFEMALDRADLVAVFGPPGPCREALAADLGVVDRIDYLFMLTYGTMLVAALIALGRRRMVLLAILAPLADATENVALLAMNIDEPGGWIALLAVAARAKFVLLGAASCAIAVATWRHTTGRMRWFALAHAPALPATIVGCAFAAASPLLTPAVAISWFAAIVWAGLSLRARRSPA